MEMWLQMYLCESLPVITSTVHSTQNVSWRLKCVLLSRKSESEKATAHGVIPALSPSGKGQTLGTVEQRFGVAVRRKGRAERTFQALAESVWYINGMQCAVTHLSKPAEQTGPSRQLQIWVRVTCRCHQCPLRGGVTVGEAVHVWEAFVFLLDFAVTLKLL